MEVIKLRSRIRVAIASGRALKTVYSELKAEGRVSGTYKSFWGKRQKVLRLAQALRFKAAKRTSATSTNPAGASVRRRAHGARAGVQARRVHHT